MPSIFNGDADGPQRFPSYIAIPMTPICSWMIGDLAPSSASLDEAEARAQNSAGPGTRHTSAPNH